MKANRANELDDVETVHIALIDQKQDFIFFILSSLINEEQENGKSPPHERGAS